MDMDILAISNLLSEPKLGASDRTSDGRNKSTNKTSQLTPALFGALSEGGDKRCTPKINTENNSNTATTQEKRPEPAFQIYYKQIVGTEDIFLGTEKTLASSDCTHIIVKIHFPSCNKEDLKLDVTSSRLTAETSDKKLSMILPQEVKDKLGNAKWDATQEVLIVTLPINQEATITGMLR